MAAPRTCILGLSGFALELGIRLLRINHPVEGVYDPDHDLALRHCLTLGCSAYTHPAELIEKSEVVFSFLGPARSSELGLGFVLCGEGEVPSGFSRLAALSVEAYEGPPVTGLRELLQAVTE